MTSKVNDVSKLLPVPRRRSSFVDTGQKGSVIFCFVTLEDPNDVSGCG